METEKEKGKGERRNEKQDGADPRRQQGKGGKQTLLFIFLHIADECVWRESECGGMHETR